MGKNVLISGVNDLQSQRPDIAKEFDVKKNGITQIKFLYILIYPINGFVQLPAVIINGKRVLIIEFEQKILVAQCVKIKF